MCPDLPLTEPSIESANQLGDAPDSAPDSLDELELTIVIVSYNTRQMTLECLRSVILQTTIPNYEIIVLDNNSDDGSADAIESEFPNISLIRSKDNLGFARANNFAANVARGRLLLLLNPDTLILDHAIDRLVAFAGDNPECKIWGGRTFKSDGSLNPKSCWREMSLWSLFCLTFGLSHFAPDSALFSSEAYGGWNRNTVRHVDIVSGCFFLIERAFWIQLRGFDPAFFMYAEEADLCLRARTQGANPIITPEASIIHYGEASERSRADKLLKMLKGKVTIMYRHWSPKRRMMGRALMLLLPLVRWWGYSVAAALTGRPGFSLAAKEWRIVWLRRSDWLSGYSRLPGQ